MFEWDDARYFLAVHRACSVSGAGRQLKVNQSTVSRRIKALEERLGASLFVQTPDGYQLAPAGELLLPHAERMEEEALAIERKAGGQDEGLTGVVRVTAPDAFGAKVVTPLLVDFQRKYPGIDVELVAENRTLNLTKREADLAIRTWESEPSLITRKICTFASAIYATESYLAKYGIPDGKDEYAGHVFLGFEDATWSESRWMARHATAARITMRTNSTFAQLEATLAGMGIGVLPCYLGDDEPTLVRLISPDKFVVRSLSLLLHRDLQHATRIRACADFLVAGIRAKAARIEGKNAAARIPPP